MDESTANVFVNREEPAGLIAIPGSDRTSSDPESKRDRSKNTRFGSKLAGKIQNATSIKSESGRSLQDRLFTK